MPRRPAVLDRQPDIGQARALPAPLLRRSDQFGVAVEHHRAVLVGAAAGETQLAAGRLALHDLDAGGDRVPGAQSGAECQILTEMGRARTRQPGPQHGRDQRAAPHAVRDHSFQMLHRPLPRIEGVRPGETGERGE